MCQDLIDESPIMYLVGHSDRFEKYTKHTTTHGGSAQMLLLSKKAWPGRNA